MIDFAEPARVAEIEQAANVARMLHALEALPLYKFRMSDLDDEAPYQFKMPLPKIVYPSVAYYASIAVA